MEAGHSTVWRFGRGRRAVKRRPCHRWFYGPSLLPRCEKVRNVCPSNRFVSLTRVRDLGTQRIWREIFGSRRGFIKTYAGIGQIKSHFTFYGPYTSGTCSISREKGKLQHVKNVEKSPLFRDDLFFWSSLDFRKERKAL